jgi:hypothetical protein
VKTWALRALLAAAQLALLVAGLMFYAHIRLTQHVSTCTARVPKIRVEPGSGLAAAKLLVECLDREADPISKLVYINDYRKPVTAAEPVACKYVGEWKATRDPSIAWTVTLNADGSFTARSDRGASPVMTGTWALNEGRIGWLYDNALQFPFDNNRVTNATETGFTLVERDGSGTRYALVRRLSQASCK